MNNNLARVPGFLPKTPNSKHPSWSRLSKNYMEVLVREEVERQVEQLPAEWKAKANYAEIAAYALNRLPALYATTKRGRMIQQWKVEASIRQSVRDAVQKGIALSQKEPRRMGEAWEDPEVKPSDTVLQELKILLQYPDLDWDNLTTVIKNRMIQVSRSESQRD
jgi:hypothetical protein